MYNRARKLLTSREKFHIKLGLERVQELLGYFGNPQDRIRCVHVAGTNGKGSTCAILESVLRQAGYKTGLYTSPHLVDYTERIKINGEDISRDEFASLIFRVSSQTEPQKENKFYFYKEQNSGTLPGKTGVTGASDYIIPEHKPFFNPVHTESKIPATEFEILTVAAFICFFEKNVDVAIIETGLGGRLDATNVIKKPDLSIITSIDIDHADRLGNTIDKIAFEKAGIIKQNVPVITLKDNNGLDIIQQIARENSSPVFLEDYKKAKTNLMGLHQKKNASLAKKAACLLQIPDHAIKAGLNNVSWPARFQFIEDENIIIDAAHNPAGSLCLRESLDFYFPHAKRVFVYSSLKIKDYENMARNLFRKEDTVILTKCSSTSAEDPEVIKRHVKCKKIYITDSVKKSLEVLKSFNKKEFLIIFTGSIYTIGEGFSMRVLPDRLNLL